MNNKNWHHVVVTTGTNVNASNVSLGVASSTYFPLRPSFAPTFARGYGGHGKGYGRAQQGYEGQVGGSLDEPMGLTSALVDSLRMYNRALSASEVTRLYGLGN